jgi:hypothetical protein
MYEPRHTPTPQELQAEMEVERQKKLAAVEPGKTVLDALEHRMLQALHAMKEAVGLDDREELIKSPVPERHK